MTHRDILKPDRLHDECLTVRYVQMQYVLAADVQMSLLQFARETGQFGKFGNAPLAIMAPALGVLGGAVRGILPG